MAGSDMVEVVECTTNGRSCDSMGRHERAFLPKSVLARISVFGVVMHRAVCALWLVCFGWPCNSGRLCLSMLCILMQ